MILDFFSDLTMKYYLLEGDENEEVAGINHKYELYCVDKSIDYASECNLEYTDIIALAKCLSLSKKL